MAKLIYASNVSLDGSRHPRWGKPALPTHMRAELELLDERRFGNGVVHLRYTLKRNVGGRSIRGLRPAMLQFSRVPEFAESTQLVGRALIARRRA
jgi:hypothetical protein